MPVTPQPKGQTKKPANNPPSKPDPNVGKGGGGQQPPRPPKPEKPPNARKR